MKRKFEREEWDCYIELATEPNKTVTVKVSYNADTLFKKMGLLRALENAIETLNEDIINDLNEKNLERMGEEINEYC